MSRSYPTRRALDEAKEDLADESTRAESATAFCAWLKHRGADPGKEDLHARSVSRLERAILKGQQTVDRLQHKVAQVTQRLSKKRQTKKQVIADRRAQRVLRDAE